jgi:hypothetical protein
VDKPLGGSLGERKFAFLYLVISTVAIAGVMTISGLSGLSWWQSLLMLIGSLIVVWTVLFTFLEVRRLGQTPKGLEGPAEGDPYAPRKLVVAPPTGDAYPHHEDYVESQGFDQGQLTSRIADSTPFVDRLLRRREKKELAAR